jgi:hypothetical protein
MNEDVSKKTIVVLVILTVLVSTLGTLTVLNSVDDKLATPGSSVNTVGEGTTTQTGEVKVQIVRPVKTTGKVTVNVVNQ